MSAIFGLILNLISCGFDDVKTGGGKSYSIISKLRVNVVS